MKTIYLFTLSTILSISCLQAQQQPSVITTKADSVTEEVSHILVLDQEQQSAVQLTWLEYFEDVEALHEKGEMGKRAFKKSVQRLDQVRDLKMKGILDEDQFIRYEAYVESLPPAHEIL